ncbi:hypothetical protein WA026_000955 [Henosepilachna vigintioctopunctata]|uniref:RCC1-like domain-containing protein n=1 Tax=Henosepilachna vigintioctopunctata TaxID=420089 RepID=A0AAW1V6M2_9CUCU
MLLYSWGANSYGQLGLGYKSEEEIVPKEVPLDNSDLNADEIVSIAGGAGHTLILNNKGQVYCCGWNKMGQLGSFEDTLKFTQIEILNGFKIVHISCGWDFSAAVSECGKQFVWGNNNFTQLGLSKSITCTGIPSRLQVSQKLATGFQKVSCGLRHSAIITKDKELLMTGSGKNGQLGLGDNYDDDNYLSISKVPNLVDVISVASGENHTVCLKEDGTVLTWGENKFGQLGLNPNVDKSFVPVEVFSGVNLKEVYAGWTHSAVLTTSGHLLNWGRNSYGQLGSSRVSPFQPVRVPNLPEIEHFSAGSEHNLALTKDNKLFAWGWNEHGSCGTGDKKDVLSPTQIMSDFKVKIAFACTGSSFAVLELL